MVLFLLSAQIVSVSAYLRGETQSGVPDKLRQTGLRLPENETLA